MLENGKAFSNFEFLLLPGAIAVSGPANYTFPFSSATSVPATTASQMLSNAMNITSSAGGGGAGHATGNALSTSTNSGRSSPVSAGSGKYSARYSNT